MQGDVILTGIFGIEIILKTFAFGLLPYFESHTHKVRSHSARYQFPLYCTVSINIRVSQQHHSLSCFISTVITALFSYCDIL